MPTKKYNIFTTKRFWAGILLAQFLLFFSMSHVQFFVNLFQKLFEFQKTFHQKIFAVFPFSVGDLLYILLGMVLIYFLIKIFKKKNRNLFLLRFLGLMNFLYFIYQFFWGMMYFQQPIIEKLPKDGITLEATKTLTLKYLNLCKKTRIKTKEDQNGVFKITNSKSIENDIIHNQNKLPDVVCCKKVTNINSFKPSLYKGVMNFSGILGYYNPFTAEAQYNADLPSSYLPFTLAHESSHQLGFAREQEANFIAYLIGKDSENLELKYSTEYFVLKSLLNSLAEKNPEFVKEILQNYSPGMKRDRLAEKKFIKNHEGILDSFFKFTNDLFLKSNQQDGSVTYSYFVDLLLRYEK